MRGGAMAVDKRSSPRRVAERGYRATANETDFLLRGEAARPVSSESARRGSRDSRLDSVAEATGVCF